ncbi:MAG: NAD-dependent epimerase/dehydratase family protein [Actinobacteria bacterium]|nr:NAD-dependent epimerase/dehydratase family protein [Actinomycetota bacterium]
MRIVVVGGSGNVGTSVLRALDADPAVKSLVGVARRRPEFALPKLEWSPADIRTADLASVFRGADVVIHLAWVIQPSHDLAGLHSTNVGGSQRLFDAVVEAGVPSLVYASSVGAYSPGPKDRPVDESWPTDGIASSFYSRHKAATERQLDRLEARHREVRVVRLRKALIFKGEAGSGVRRLFLGSLLPVQVLRPAFIPLVPRTPGLRFQAVHTDDVAEAYRLAALGTVRGAFNIAADPVLDPDTLAQLLSARPVPVPAGVLRAAAALSWRVGLQPTPAGWVDLALQVPILDTTRARVELGWTPRRSAGEALLELLDGLRQGAGVDTPPLEPWRGASAETRAALRAIAAERGAA